MVDLALVPARRRLLNCKASVGISEGPLRVPGSFLFTGIPVSEEELSASPLSSSRNVLEDTHSLSQ
jgi:hypothetical protein